MKVKEGADDMDFCPAFITFELCTVGMVFYLDLLCP